jgi:hypothetical protein
VEDSKQKIASTITSTGAAKIERKFIRLSTAQGEYKSNKE